MNRSSRPTQTKLISFSLDDAEFVLNADRIKEVLSYTALRTLPKMPRNMKGLVNLNKRMIPVLDLRHDEIVCEGVRTVKSCISLVEIALSEKRRVLGILLDSHQEIYAFEPGITDRGKKVGTTMQTEFSLGMCMHEDQFIVMQDTDKILTADELKELKASVINNTNGRGHRMASLCAFLRTGTGIGLNDARFDALCGSDFLAAGTNSP
ncbi:MAG: chemotaxis protein CheW [Magnetococcales bacterium]|nr:chemotaxis protein CheW [Magnetococcales bacterium]